MIELIMSEGINGIEIRGDVHDFIPYTENPVYLMLRELVRANGGKLVFNSVYELIIFLQKYMRSIDVLDFAQWILPDNEEHYKFFALARAEPTYHDLSDFTIIPKNMLNEIYSEVEENNKLLYHRWFNVSKHFEGKSAELTDVSVFFPTKLGFAKLHVKKVEISPKSVIVRFGKREYDVYYPQYATFGELIVLLQFVDPKILSVLPIPEDLVNPVARYYKYTTLDTVIILYAVGELKGTTMTLPIIEPSGITWKTVRITSTKVVKDGIYLYYKHKDFIGRLALVVASRNRKYNEAINEVLERNPWLRERIMKNTEKLIDLLRRYREFMPDFETKVKLLL